MEREYNHDIAQRVIEALEGVKLRFTFDSDAGIAKLSMGQVGPFRKVDIFVEVRSEDVLTYTFFPLYADSKNPMKLADMAEFITRANYGMCNGCFEMDFRDGEIRFKSYIDCDEQIPGDKVIINSIFTSIAVIKRYIPGFIGIMFMDKSPAAMIAKCEGSLRGEGEDVTGLFNRLLEENGVGNGRKRDEDRDGPSGDEGGEGEEDEEEPEKDPYDDDTDEGEKTDGGDDEDDDEEGGGNDGSGFPF